MNDDSPDRHSHLSRLAPEFYRGQAYVHWTMTIDERKTGWLVPIFYYKFRELFVHMAFRYGLCCPVYCCMPDHIHLLLVGILDGCDQQPAVKFFRAQLNPVLEKLGAQLQLQPYDHVLRENERQEAAFEGVVEYIARNPERSGLIPRDQFKTYKYTGCIMPGYPDLSPWQPDYWPLFWRIYSRLRATGLVRSHDEPPYDIRS